VLIGAGLSTSAAMTEELGRAFGAALGEAVTWSLNGELGSGKTVLARGLLRGLGIAGAVRSPSFVLAIPYRGRLPVVHVDLYRLDQTAAIEQLAWDDWLGAAAVLLVEWGERARALLGPDRLEVQLEHRGEERRAIRVLAHGTAATRLGATLRHAWPAGWPALD
jgi:tRNA threonylcarbamoyladenosine biosynthesis protein TsaE